MLRSALPLLAGLLVVIGCCSARQPTLDDLMALPGCEGADWGTLVANSQRQECLEFAADMYSNTCPAACAEGYQALGGVECYASLARFSWKQLGITVGDDVALPFANATLEACQLGEALEMGPLVAVAQATFGNYPSCASADWEAAISSGCGLEEALTLATGVCPAGCAAYVKGVGTDCMVDFTLGVAKAQLGLEVSDDMLQLATERIRELFGSCSNNRRPRSRKLITHSAGAVQKGADMDRLAAVMAVAGGQSLFAQRAA